MTNMPAYTELRHALDNRGLLGAMQYLNARVPHRFTVVYRLDHGALRVSKFFDRQSVELPEILREIPLDISFCQFALRDGFFTTDDSLHDSRLEGQPLRPVMQSYVGLPLAGPAGQLIGTFCHIDLSPQSISDDEFAFLSGAVRLLPGYLPA